jgi:tetratricopeptide (TPR) repeat protein
MDAPTPQEQFDDAMVDFTTADYATAITKFTALLDLDPNHFDARLALGMTYYRLGDYVAAIREGHRAEALRPKESLVHTNLSLFYMKHGDKPKAEHHGLQARIVSWAQASPPGSQGQPNVDAAGASGSGPANTQDPDLAMAQPKPQPMKFSGKLPDMPWKKKT